MPTEAHMIWNLIFLLVHLAALAGFIYLYRAAPCWMQKVSVVGFVIAMTLFTMSFGLGLMEVEGHRHLAILGMAIEHLAVLLYVFRLIYQGSEWKTSSAPSLSSSR